jgi:stalled ribosome rescue protein Dom34
MGGGGYSRDTLEQIKQAMEAERKAQEAVLLMEQRRMQVCIYFSY